MILFDPWVWALWFISEPITQVVLVILALLIWRVVVHIKRF